MAEHDLYEAWMTIFKVQDIEGLHHTLDNKAPDAALLTKERIHLPLRHGGMGVPAIKSLGDSALVAFWAEIAARVAEIPALECIADHRPGSDGDGGPVWGLLNGAWKRVWERAMEAEEPAPLRFACEDIS